MRYSLKGACLLRLAFSVVSPFLASALGAQPAASRVAVLLAGQSNMESLGIYYPQCASQASAVSNVTYHFGVEVPSGSGTYALSTALPISVVQASPAFVLGNTIGRARPNDVVQIVMMAKSGSSLVASNGSLHWINDTDPLNGSGLVHRYQPLLAALDFDELHFVWAQGESDCLAPVPITQATYSGWAQVAFAIMALHAGAVSYRVHLVTLGAMNVTNASSVSANAVRDAFRDMVSSTVPLPGLLPSYAIVAHHYDLDHADGLHLTPCEYFTLASRIAAGMVSPGDQPRAISRTVSSQAAWTDVDVATTTGLQLVAPTATRNGLFEVIVNGQVYNNFVVSAGATGLKVRVFHTSVNSVQVRHVPGTGNGLAWDTLMPFLGAASNSPLEPFVVQ